MDSAGVERAGRILVAPAMEHDAPKLPFRLACEWLSSSRVVRPSVVNVLERVPAHADPGPPGNPDAGGAPA